MDVIVELVGDGTREVSVPDGATYGELLAAVDLSRHEATVLVDGTPVPEDQPVDTARVTVLRLVRGG